MSSNKSRLQHSPTDKQLSASSEKFHHALKLPLQRSPSSSQTSLKTHSLQEKEVADVFCLKTLKNMLETLEDKLVSKLDEKLADVAKKEDLNEIKLKL